MWPKSSIGVKKGVQLVTEMETSLKTLDLILHENNNSPGIILLESQFLAELFQQLCSLNGGEIFDEISQILSSFGIFSEI